MESLRRVGTWRGRSLSWLNGDEAGVHVALGRMAAGLGEGKGGACGDGSEVAVVGVDGLGSVGGLARA
jgi:hypothetical protein